jgi:nitrile hydratase
MNGAHDMGGFMGYGPVKPENNEPVFHANWEARVFALINAVGEHGRWTLDEDRHASENHPPAEYLALTYYEIWLATLSKLMVEKNMITAAELKTGKLEGEKLKLATVLKPDAVMAAVTAPGTYVRDVAAKPRFQPGDRVRARNIHPLGHTRLPRYVRGHVGEIAKVHGAHVFPDSNAHGKGEDPHWLYTVRFTAQELWGSNARDLIHVELWEPYLEPV